MEVGVTGEQVLGYCESRDENTAKIEQLKEQIKAINEDSAGLTKITAGEFKVHTKDLNDVYKRYCDMKEQPDQETDFYELLALLEDAMDSEAPPKDDD
jgi:Cdc6-like AAA superfamily ATPase